MAKLLSQHSWSILFLCACLQTTTAIIFPSGCPSSGCGDGYFIPQSQIDATCNNMTHVNRYYYDKAVHYMDKDAFLSNIFSKLTQAVVVGTVSNIYRQNFTENLVAQDQTKPSRVTQEYYMVDVSVSCILKYEKLPSDRYFFQLPQPVFWKADCPPRDVAKGERILMGFSAGHNTFCSWQECKPIHWWFSGFSLYKMDNEVLGEITKSCGFQKPTKPEGATSNTCPSISVTDKTCINRENSAGIYLPRSSLIVAMICMLLMS